MLFASGRSLTSTFTMRIGHLHSERHILLCSQLKPSPPRDTRQTAFKEAEKSMPSGWDSV